MSFPPSVKGEAFVRSRRRCCVCHEFAGRNVDVHHILPQAQGGPDTLDNAIVLCLCCHAEAGHYNPQHPIGNKYSPQELRRHRDLWWEWCETYPDAPIRTIPPGYCSGYPSHKTGDERAASQGVVNRIYHVQFVATDRRDATASSAKGLGAGACAKRT